MSPPKKRRWEVVYDELREEVDQGKRHPGDPIPLERELMEHHGVSRNTVRTALSHLEAQGVITPPRGRLGRAVAEYRPLYWHLSRFEVGDRRDDPDTGTDEWAADMREQGREPHQVVKVAKLPIPTSIAELLDVEPNEWLLRRRRIRSADDTPVSIADTWLPEDVAAMTVKVGDQQICPWTETQDVVLTGGIVAALGLRQDYADDVVHVRHASLEEAELLQINASTTPVGEHTRVAYEKGTGRPLRVLRTVFPGPRLYLRYQVKFRDEEDDES